jgi:predicted Zn-dependent peptidase
LEFHEARLQNGLQIIAELSPSVHSVGIGFFVRTGARDEASDVAGVSHFLEHMAFKGTDRFSADDVNRIFDEVGAKYNASTSEEVTLFYAAVLPEYVSRTMELLSGIIQPSLRPADFEVEKNVILEEIGMYDDQPTFVAYEKLMQAHFAGHALGQSILGTPESIKALTAEQMQEYHRTHYLAGNIVLAIAGNYDWPALLELAEKACGGWPAGSVPRSVIPAHPPGGLQVITKSSSVQQHVMHMAPAPEARHRLRYAAELLSVVVGDDSGSRLYWDMVDPGYAETAEIGYNEFDGSGVYLTYFNCNPEDTNANSKRIEMLFEQVNREGISEIELSQAKNKVLCIVVLRSERPMGRLASLGNNWVYRDEYHPVEAELAAVRAVSLADIRELLDEFPLGHTTTVTVGPLESFPGQG